MKPIAFATAILTGSLLSTSVLACNDLNEAMTEFNAVKDAYVAKAPTLKPEQFQVWAKHIQGFSTAMGKMDYAAACRSLEMASAELGLDSVDAATTTATPPPPPPAASDSSNATPPPLPGTATESNNSATATAPVTPPANSGSSPTPPVTSGTSSGSTPAWTECPRGRCR